RGGRPRPGTTCQKAFSFLGRQFNVQEMGGGGLISGRGLNNHSEQIYFYSRPRKIIGCGLGQTV
ncbi:MAG: hypothetical protein MR686_01560, partial [Collinsella sp.]|nr:hypothetical protein [Collinsella sp.]